MQKLVKFLSASSEIVDYLTVGKTYIANFKEGMFFSTLGDDGEIVWGIYPSCAHGVWKIVEETE